ncbi:MAG: hypothetical protein ACTSRU_01775 [Candidatus Hodarchaeales archaeon]
MNEIFGSLFRVLIFGIFSYIIYFVWNESRWYEFKREKGEFSNTFRVHRGSGVLQEEEYYMPDFGSSWITIGVIDNPKELIRLYKLKEKKIQYKVQVKEHKSLSYTEYLPEGDKET